MRYYWIECKLQKQRGDDLGTIQTFVTQLTVIERKKGEIIFLFGRKWIVTDCYPA